MFESVKENISKPSIATIVVHGFGLLTYIVCENLSLLSTRWSRSVVYAGTGSAMLLSTFVSKKRRKPEEKELQLMSNNQSYILPLPQVYHDEPFEPRSVTRHDNVASASYQSGPSIMIPQEHFNV